MHEAARGVTNEPNEFGKHQPMHVQVTDSATD
jgi:hypothetical protein